VRAGDNAHLLVRRQASGLSDMELLRRVTKKA
jgi:hypothetical protein